MARPVGYFNPFKSWTGERLVLSNYLRPKPVTYKQLSAYAGHGPLTLRVMANKLRRQGRLTKENVVVLSDPANAALRLEPLPDLRPATAAPFSHVNAALREEAVESVQRALPDLSIPKDGTLSESKLLEILDSYILAGGAGRDFVQAIKTRFELAPSLNPVGPPPPSTDGERIDRLLSILLASPRHCAAAAIARFQELPPDAEPEQPPQPPEAPGGVDPTDL